MSNPFVIHVSYGETPEAIARVRKMLEDTALHDPVWRGVEFSIRPDDFTCIPGSDRNDIDAAILLGRVRLALRGGS